MTKMKFPENWVLTSLNEIAKWGSGGTPKRNNNEYYDGDINWVKTGDLNNGLIKETSEKISKKGLDNSSAKIFPEGSVAIAMYGATIGKTSIFGFEAATNQACAVAITYSGISKYFLHYYLKSQKQSFIDKGKGGAQPNISQTIIKAHPFPLPPLAEQNRIVKKLDTLFGHLDVLKERLDKIPQLLKDFRHSVLSQAVSGKLTEEWRERKELGDWVEKCLPDLGELTRGKSKHRPRNDKSLYGGKYPFIQTGDVTKSVRYITSHKQSYNAKGLAQSRLFPKGTLCITIAANIGETAILSYDSCFPDSVVGFLPNIKKYSSEIAMYYFETIKNELDQNASAVAQKNINLKVLSGIKFPVPPLIEQEEIARCINSLFSKADKIEKKYNALKEKIDHLPQAILAKAFRGELVPQLKSDADAQELLEEIREMKEELSSKKGKVKVRNKK